MAGSLIRGTHGLFEGDRKEMKKRKCHAALKTAGRFVKLDTMNNVFLQNIGSIQLYPSVNQFSSEFRHHTFRVHLLDS